MKNGTPKVGEETPSIKEPLLDPKLKDFPLDVSDIQAAANMTMKEEDKGLESFLNPVAPPDLDDIIVNNTNESIDFDQELKDLKKRTELDIPYVSTMTEDAMYIDQHTIVTIEYHYY